LAWNRNQPTKILGPPRHEAGYAYLDADVAKWLKENAPKPQKGQNSHQWLTSQYGLKILVEHILDAYWNIANLPQH